MKADNYLGGVRELSYDPKHARPYGQTAAEIREESDLQRCADNHGEYRGLKRHAPRPDRYYVLRFLGLIEEAEALLQ
jgi:hypothetical protein